MASRLFTPLVSTVLLLIVTGLLYWPTIGYPFVFEDLNDRGRLERSVFGPDSAINPARVLTEVTHEFGLWLSPGSAAGGHAVNVAWHLVNVALLFALAWLWLPRWGAVVAAGIFALHPLQVETVAYVSSRSELVAASGVLLALLSTSVGSLAGAVVGVLFACLGKESAVMAWGLVPLWAVATRAAFPIRRFLLIGGVLAAVGAVLFLSRVTHLAVGFDLEHLGRTSAAVARLVSLVFLPVGLSIDHDWRGVALWLQSLSVGVLVAGTVAALWTVQRGSSWLSLAWLMTLLWFLPRFLVPGVEGLHEHHMAIPLVGWSLCIGAWLSHSRTYAGA